MSEWVVYVIQSQQPRKTASGKPAEGFSTLVVLQMLIAD